MALNFCRPPTGNGPSIVLSEAGVPTRTDLPVGTVITDSTTGLGYTWTGSAWDPVGTNYTDEQVRDVMGAALTAGAGISVTPNDPGDTITIASTITQYTDEMARDALGSALVAGSGVTITPNDGADTITIAASGGGGALTKISETVTSGSQSSVTFSSIPGTYRDLLVVVTGRSTVSALNADVAIRFNGDTGSNYDHILQAQNNTGVAGGAAVTQTFGRMGWLVGATGPANLRSSGKITIYDYASTTFYKQWSSEEQYLRQGTTAGSVFAGSYVGDWRSTAAITSITVFPDSGNFVDGTVATLYGVG